MKDIHPQIQEVKNSKGSGNLHLGRPGDTSEHTAGKDRQLPGLAAKPRHQGLGRGQEVMRRCSREETAGIRERGSCKVPAES